MLRGYYTAASGMIAQQRRQETMSNNIANALTPGYKQDQSTLRSFPEMLIQRMESNKLPTSRSFNVPMNAPIGSINTGVYVQENVSDFSQGSLKQTSMSTDLALVDGTMPDETGSIFFTVQNPEGELRYTRNGNFTADADGYLVTNQGYYVLDQAGNRIATGGVDFKVTGQGELQLPNQNVPIGVAYSANVNDLIKEGEGLYRAEGAPLAEARGQAGISFSIQQGYLEGSNVDMAQTATEMMSAYRLFEANQKVLKAYDQSMDKAVNEIGRVR
ncbi:flagellar hook-basal body protein [Radiobacillus kanasensis]|uniref:flagellar hook-basal body protein n=1 Tax=Radiobacillus kanasensis TaxID=2844358 RepID=UPI001E5CBF4A|nr:flagellar hook-basal body complex protein [Radiobacillus kanasensis]UFT98905.1 flagellar hook-basal body protein [Radiobacillus kanasensis]